ncbi:hypothetical protein CAP48_06455 [Advenella sp. S44]|uniref:PIG-L family deacetylase n=1 Tax=Advenella sp. S44 TaxID=1982755 RepID=UPI000C2A08CA|nr:PIG-L family deacetylase [Advenella sp. S44]PJX25681.1 hypothetical protein CAP48_06455 [Advenella sp. S44]
MVTPLHRGQLLVQAAQAPAVSVQALAGQANVLILSPHPDDETLGCAQAIAAACDSGRKVFVVVITNGNLSHPGSLRYPKAALAALRRQECMNALDVVGGVNVVPVFMDYDDQCAPNTVSEQIACIARLEQLVRECKITAVWTSWEQDPHCDHQRVARLGELLLARQPQLVLFKYPIWGRFLPEAQAVEGTLYQFTGTGDRNRKARALECYRSQMTSLIDDDPQGFVMAPETRAHFLDTPELFISYDIAARALEFDALYMNDSDPWQFLTSEYENSKYVTTLSALPRPRYRRAIEAGCSIGVLTEKLSARCDEVIGLDISGVAVDLARARNRHIPQIQFRQAPLPQAWPQESADLIVLSEILYFLDVMQIEQLAGQIARTWEKNGDCIVVNFSGDTCQALHGKQAATIFCEAIRRYAQVDCVLSQTYEKYSLLVLNRIGDPTA